MKLVRREFLRLTGAAIALPAISRAGWSQSYPARPVRLIVGFSAGGTTDIAARLMGEWLSERLGQPVIIENRPGAAANLAAEAVVRAPSDGYTLLAASSTNAINATFYERLSFNFVRDIAMVGGITRSPLVLEVNPSVPVKTVPELIAYAKANTDKINLGSYGTGSTSHLAGELFKSNAGIQMQHMPYRGSTPMITDLIGGQIQVAFDNLPASIEHIKSGNLRALAVGTAVRSESLPDVPTVAESLSGFEASAWIAVGAPKNTPREIIERLNAEMNAGLAAPKVRERLASLGGAVLMGLPSDFDKLLADETEKWGRVIRTANLKAS
jgi:tripartite-type tricarboxylate transporter receptor subunit TctC